MVSHHILIPESSEQNTILILKQDSSRNRACLYATGITGSQMRFATYISPNREVHEILNYSRKFSHSLLVIVI